MRKVLNILTALLILGSASQYSQTKFNLNVYGGYSIPLSQLSGDFPDTLNSTGRLDFTRASTLLAKSGFNFGAVIKYAVDTTGNARLTGGLNYNSFTGSKDYKSGARTYISKTNIISISVGAEYSFSPNKKVNPFLGLEGAANFFSGKITSEGDTSFSISRQGESRFGVVLNGGINIQIKENMGIIFGVKYAMANLIGKSTESTATSSNPNTDDEGGETLALIELPLNDAETSSNRTKNLNYFQIYAGLSFNFGDKLSK
jgi:outer membrane protein W